jgi:hypothetical protein
VVCVISGKDKGKGQNGVRGNEEWKVESGSREWKVESGKSRVEFESGDREWYSRVEVEIRGREWKVDKINYWEVPAFE